MAVRVKLTVAYDGAGFHGFAPNPGVRTVAGELVATIARILGHPVALVGAGRTDAGVHARGQVVSFDTTTERVDVAALQRSINKLCGPELVVRHATAVGTNFDARRSAVSRIYRYRVLNEPVPDPHVARTAWHISRPLRVRAMELACDSIIGEHDFTSFCRRPKGVTEEPSLVRVVHDARWESDGEGVLSFWIEASAFCHQMVRSIVGTMVDVGLGNKRAGELGAILRARDRHYAGTVAPPHGLFLWEVRYSGW